MKALNLSGGKHLSAATMFWPDTLSCTLQPSSKGREISQSQEKRWRAEGFSRAVSSNHLLNDPNPLKLDNNTKRGPLEVYMDPGWLHAWYVCMS